MKIHMFPGQGSQYRGMGGGLFADFKALVEEADGILGYSVERLCLEDPEGQLSNTRFTQPALFVVNALSYRRKLEETGQPPDFAIGHSLGEFNALWAAECFDFATGLKLVQKRGELMSEVSGGAMAAVLNAGKDDIERTLKANGLHNVYLANYNTPSQIVLSGLAAEIAEAETLFQEGKMRYYPLATSGAFHSAYMRDAMARFRAYLQGFEFAAPKMPVIANVTARPYEAGAWAETLSSQIASTVRWCESVQYLLALGASRGEAVKFEELGPGDVLTKLAYTIEMQTPRALLDESARDLFAAVPAKSVGARQKVAAWNTTHPVGTRLKSTIAEYDELETRTEAVVLFGHRAAVYMKGFNGYFDLDELIPA